MNQGKLEIVKQDMARVNVDILGISELKWTGMGEFNSDDHYIYYCRAWQVILYQDYQIFKEDSIPVVQILLLHLEESITNSSQK